MAIFEHPNMQTYLNSLDLFRVPGYRILEIICSLFPVWASVVNATQGGQ